MSNTFEIKLTELLEKKQKACNSKLQKHLDQIRELLKCYYDDIFSIEAILRQTSSLHEKKNAVYYSQVSLFVSVFKICILV